MTPLGWLGRKTSTQTIGIYMYLIIDRFDSIDGCKNQRTQGRAGRRIDGRTDRQIDRWIGETNYGCFGILRPFQHYLAISRIWKGDNERLWVMKGRTLMSWIQLLTGFEPGNSWSDVVSANHSVTPTLQKEKETDISRQTVPNTHTYTHTHAHTHTHTHTEQ